MKALDEALATLATARPDPAVVERLAAETIARRETPHASLPTFQRSSWLNLGKHGNVEMGHTVCGLCGALLNHGLEINSIPFYRPDLHLEWHNNQERRLRKLEEGVA